MLRIKYPKMEDEIQLPFLDKSLPPQHIECEKIAIRFPFTAYSIQSELMTELLKGLKNHWYCLLESPTGTGKTLSLLCGSLAYLEYDRERALKQSEENEEIIIMNDNRATKQILYLVRTHSQLKQIVDELRKTSYRPYQLSAASRDNYCVNHSQDIEDLCGEEKNNKCRKLCKIKKCPYNENFQELSKNSSPKLNELLAEIKDEVADAEGIKQKCEKLKICPYKFVNKMKKSADIILMPYNYAIMPSIREVQEVYYGVSLSEKILIFDEGHNVPKACEEASSYEFSQDEIGQLNGECNDVKSIIYNILYLNREYEGISSEEVRNSNINTIEIKGPIKLFKSEIKSIQFGEGEKYIQRSAEGVFKLIEVGQYYISIIEQIYKIFSLHRNLPILYKWIHFLKLVTQLRLNYEDSKNKGEKPQIEAFKIVFKWEKYMRNNTSTLINIFSLVCSDASYQFQEIAKLNPHSIILASGTLSPFSYIESELKVKFPIKLECNHVIANEQVNIGILSKFSYDYPFRFTEKTKSKTDQLENLGLVILGLSKIVPGGVLVFFSSYERMQNTLNYWSDKTNILDHINLNKKVFAEKKGTKEFNKMFDGFKSAIREIDCNSKEALGGIFFGVMRGKISEGIDFSDSFGRLVIVVGIPYACIVEPKIRIKREYLTSLAKIQKSHIRKQKDVLETEEIDQMDGEIWYAQNAILAVNQSIGRIIRHIRDFGAILLIDERYEEYRNRGIISKWLRSSIKSYDSYNEYEQQLSDFFQIVQDLPNVITAKVQNKELKDEDMDESGENRKLSEVQIESVVEEQKDEVYSVDEKNVGNFIQKPTEINIIDELEEAKLENMNEEEERNLQNNIMGKRKKVEKGNY